VKSDPVCGRILGVDPGSLHTGFGFIDIRASGESHVLSGRISPKNPIFAERLRSIFLEIRELIVSYKPAAMALEDVFTRLNPKSALKLAQARGVVILAASLSGVPVHEYAPSQVKNSVCGYGAAEKSQVAYMVKKILKISEDLAPDASDALAAALCHAGRVKLDQIAGSSGPAKKGAGKSFRKMSPEDLLALGYKIADK
jgi:crossover junction endodeoxyribonuclease RuvC